MAQIVPTTGAFISGSVLAVPPGFEAIAITGPIFDDNPWDPLNDNLDPDQVNPDPFAGQNFLQAAAGGDLVEGYGGPDFILGAGGNDSLYGGSQELHQQQAEKMLGHSEQMYDFVFGSGDGAEGAAELNHYPVFSDSNDFLFGEAGNDEIYGGSGGDYMIGEIGRAHV